MNKPLFFAAICCFFLSSCNRQIGAIFTKRDNLEVRDPDFKYLSSKAKFKFDNEGKNVSATANFRIRKDSIIWISISSLGFEGARVFIDTNNVKVLDRLNKQYYEYTFEELSEEFNFDFNFKMIQSVLLGNLIEPYKKQRLQKSDKYFRYDDIQGDYHFQNFIGVISNKLEKVNVRDEATQSTISVNYSDFVLVENQIFPNEISAVINYAKGNKPNTEIYISYSKMEIETSPLRFPYSVSNKYEKK